MPLFTKESLESLRSRVNLIELMGGYLDVKRQGATYKVLCPFHDEKSPSMVVDPSDHHYHCFGCGAHGDAISFLMEYLNLSFTDAVEALAERFNVILEREEKASGKAHHRPLMRDALLHATHFFHCMLLHSKKGQEALTYLFNRGITLDFIERFSIGFAPRESDLFFKVFKEKGISREILEEVALMKNGKSFFRGRITFPIKSPSGSVVGFSARKIHEEDFGGKYINTSETPLFKKSKILFGLDVSRRAIAKSHHALIVEGQLDCLRLIDAGFDETVAALGTSFGKEHVAELKRLGVHSATLLFDGDRSGLKAMSKVGDHFQCVGIDVRIVRLPEGSDPDSFLRKVGPEKLRESLLSYQDYISFQVERLRDELGNSPAAKNQMIELLKKQIQSWEGAVMVHESLRRLASLTQITEQMLGIQEQVRFLPKVGEAAHTAIDPDRVLESDLLRWLLHRSEWLTTLSDLVTEESFRNPECRKLFIHLKKHPKATLLELAQELEGAAELVLIDEMMQKRFRLERAEQLFQETVQKLLDREWLRKREIIRQKIHSGEQSEENVLKLVKEFDSLEKQQFTI